jgi:hypothetical protein
VPIDPKRILAIISEIEQTPSDALKEMDRELLISMRGILLKHRREVDEALLRLAFIDDQQLN